LDQSQTEGAESDRREFWSRQTALWDGSGEIPGERWLRDMDKMLPPGHESPDGSQKSIENDIETRAKMKTAITGTNDPRAGLFFQ